MKQPVRIEIPTRLESEMIGVDLIVAIVSVGGNDMLFLTSSQLAALVKAVSKIGERNDD